jgi:uncharacterized protein YbjQ (UPF0145 family)
MGEPAVEQAGRSGEFGESQMKVTTLDGIAGRITEETLGIVRGTAQWARRYNKFSHGGIRHFHASNCQRLDEGLNEAKERAIAEMIAGARKCGGDAIVGMRLDVIEMSSGVFCVNATGTAVKTAKLPQIVPAYPGALGQDGLDLMPYVTARPSFEGSALRH